ncbi:MAG: LPS assembly lipoprotein LptE [Pseudolabrys sp.]|nr:LPS assembly lipoprotein LptE [Pseudolabrys sp.]
MSLSNAPRLMRVLLALSLAGLTAGCFQPLYGDRTVGKSGGSAIIEKMSSIDVTPIKSPQGGRLARLGVEVRDQLLFELTGGGPQSSSAYRLDIQMSSTQLQVIVDINSARPEIQNYGIDATYALFDLASNKVVVRGTTFSRVSYNIPGQQQRFSGDRGLRDAENRAAKVIAENIQQRLASHFAAGT